MKKTRISALIISVVIALGASASAATFTDMPADPLTATAIENAVKNGLIAGYGDGTVGPDNPIKRSEMAAIITRVCKVENEALITKFTDVSPNAWYYSTMAKAYEMGAFTGDNNNHMNPENSITFQECFQVLSNVFDLCPPYTRPYPVPNPLPTSTLLSGQRLYDVNILNDYSNSAAVADWAKPAFAGVLYNGGYEGLGNTLTPTANITRAQFSVVMNNLIQNYIDTAGEYTSLPAGNSMIRCDGVILNGTDISGDLYIGDSVSPNAVEFADVNVEGRLVVRGCATPTKKDGNIKFGEVGIAPAGSFGAVRVIRPYINFDLENAKTDASKLYGAPGTMATNCPITMN